jgi:hypothetical protein
MFKSVTGFKQALGLRPQTWLSCNDLSGLELDIDFDIDWEA